MTAEIIALVMALLSHLADITELITHIMDEPEDIDVDKIRGEILEANARIKALQEAL